MGSVKDIVQAEGLVFNKHWDIGEFAALYQDLNNNTPKHANCGHTPAEMLTMYDTGKNLAEQMAMAGQLSVFDNMSAKPKMTSVGKPSRNGPCPCGSGKKYKKCCGRN